MSLGEESFGPLCWPLKTLMLSFSQILGAGALVIAGGGLDHQFWEKKYAPDTERNNICFN